MKNLRAIAARIAGLDAKTSQAREQRSVLIVEADEAGVSRKDIADAAGISRQMCERVLPPSPRSVPNANGNRQ